jgi:Regulator of Chromosome Condensation (RCC1) repeat protein
MTQVMWDVDGEVRRALRSVVGDPHLGAVVLADPHALTNLLKDLLPDLPRESALLIAAAQCDLPGMLLGHLGQGLDVGTATRLTAGWFGERMPFTPDACGWVVAELAIALGVDPAAVSEITLPDPDPLGESGGWSGGWPSWQSVPGSQSSWQDSDSNFLSRAYSDASSSQGRVIAWGDNDEGEIDVPAGLDRVLAVAAGWYHSLALTSDGRVIAWGSGAYGMT